LAYTSKEDDDDDDDDDDEKKSIRETPRKILICRNIISRWKIALKPRR
jgi:hypothetical protein